MIPIMKTKLIIICCALLFISCLPDEEEAQIGFMFKIINSTDLEFENVKVTIGGCKMENLLAQNLIPYPVYG